LTDLTLYLFVIYTTGMPQLKIKGRLEKIHDLPWQLNTITATNSPG